MNPSTEKALQRALRAMERSHRPPRRFTLTPLLTAFGCGMSYVLLTSLLPRVWATALPGGLDAAGRLQGWPGLIWHLALFAYAHFFAVMVSFGLIFLGTTLLTKAGGIGRLLAWLVAVSTVLVNGSILYMTLRVPVDVVISNGELTAPTAILPSELSPP